VGSQRRCPGRVRGECAQCFRSPWRSGMAGSASEPGVCGVQRAGVRRARGGQKAALWVQLRRTTMARVLGGERESRHTGGGGAGGWRCRDELGPCRWFAVLCREVRRVEGEEDSGGGLLLLGVPNGPGGAVLLFLLASPFACSVRRVAAEPRCGGEVDESARVWGIGFYSHSRSWLAADGEGCHQVTCRVSTTARLGFGVREWLALHWRSPVRFRPVKRETGGVTMAEESGEKSRGEGARWGMTGGGRLSAARGGGQGAAVPLGRLRLGAVLGQALLLGLARLLGRGLSADAGGVMRAGPRARAEPRTGRRPSWAGSHFSISKP
jgi:hypothetical protein